MIRRSFHVSVRLLGGLAAGLTVLLGLAAWRLSAGPVSLAFLNPTIEESVNSVHEGFSLRLDDTILTWAGWERALDVRFVNVRALDADGKAIARVPELAVSLSAPALARGLIAPSQIELFRPSLRLRRPKQGGIAVAFTDGGEGSDDLFDRALENLLSEPDPDDAMSYLTRIDIHDADLVIEDERLATEWRAPTSDASLVREEAGLKGEVFLELDVDGRPADITMLGDYRTDSRRLDVGVSFGALLPAAYARMAPELRALDGLDLPLRGTITFTLSGDNALTLSGDNALESVGFDVTGAAGHLALPVPIAQDLGILSAAQRVAVRSVQFHGRYEGDRRQIEIGQLDIDFADGETLYIPAPLDQEIPVVALRGKGRYLEADDRYELDDLIVDLGQEGSILIPDPINHRMPVRNAAIRGRFFGKRGRLELTAFEADLHGPRATLTAAVDGIGGPMTIKAAASIRDMKADELRHYWPRSLNDHAHDWVVTNISDGIVPEAHASVIVRSDDDGSLEVKSLSGRLTLRDMTVQYLEPMPEVRNASGAARFGVDRFTIAVEEGNTPGLAVRGGIVDLVDLGTDKERAVIDLEIDGPVRAALELIDSQPLGYAAALGIDPAGTGGYAAVRLNLVFPLINDLDLDDIEVSARADVREILITDAVFDRDIKDGDVELRVDKSGMDVTGRVRLETVLGDLVWWENFAANAPFRSRFDITVDNTDIARAEDVGLDLAPFPGNFVNGPLSAKMLFTVFDDTHQRFESRVDLTPAALEIPYLGWQKAPGIEAAAEVDVEMEGDRITAIPRFTVASGDLAIAGAANYLPEGGLERIDFEQVRFGRTDMLGTMAPRPSGGWDVDVRGASVDLEPLWERMKGDGPETDDDADAISFSIAAEFDTVWLGAERRVDDVSGIFARNGDVWTAVRARGMVGDEGRLSIAIKPGPDQTRELNIHADDAGETLKVFDIYPNMTGGILDVAGIYDDSVAGRPLNGTLSIKDYRVVDAPLLAQILNVLALTGIVESLSGEGIAFSTLEAAYTLTDDILDLADARASGLSLGFTATGTVHTGDDVIDLEGTVIPAYVINSALGKIPLVGDLFTDGEEGGGVFAATYSMEGAMEDPLVSVNPLTALAPGFLRNVFGIFESDSAASEPPPPVPTNPETR